MEPDRSENLSEEKHGFDAGDTDSLDISIRALLHPGFQIIAAIQVALGVLGLLAQAAYYFFVDAGTAASTPIPSASLLTWLAILFAIGNIVAGVLLWRKPDFGVVLSVFVQLIQVPRFNLRYANGGTATEIGINFLALLLLVALIILAFQANDGNETKSSR